MELFYGLANKLESLNHEVNQWKEARDESGAKVDLRYTEVADWLRSLNACINTVPGNIQHLNANGRFQKADSTKASCLPA